MTDTAETAQGVAPRASALSCKRVDHVSFSVPDLDAAVAFFVGVLGAAQLYRRQYAPAPNSTEMVDKFNAHKNASYDLAKLDLCDMRIELFQYSAPDIEKRMPRNCDVGGSHIGIVVDDIEAAVRQLRRIPEVTVLGDISVIGGDHPLAGRKWIYFITPWGLQLELVS